MVNDVEIKGTSKNFNLYKFSYYRKNLWTSWKSPAYIKCPTKITIGWL